MTDREQNRRENDALQSGEDDPAYGQDSRDFGEGGQQVTDTIDKNDAPHRDVDRDPTLDPAHQRAS